MAETSMHEGLIAWFHRRAQADGHETWLRTRSPDQLLSIEREVEALYAHLQSAYATYAATHPPLSKGVLLYTLKLLLYASYDDEAAHMRQDVLDRITNQVHPS